MNRPNPHNGARWAPVKTGTGEIVGYLEVWWAPPRDHIPGAWVSIPGASRWKEPNGTISEIHQ